MVALKDCCASIDSSNDILHVLEALVELSPHSSLTNIVCSTSGNKKKEVYKLLLSSVRVLHNWSMVDPNWWEKVAQLPHYTSLMNFIIANAKDIQPDRQTGGISQDKSLI
ncbi:hypothetical protein Hamer_G001382, partial [Homarus americanus]